MDSQILPDGISAYSSFIAYHKVQLETANVPIHFWKTLCKKLHNQIFDAGSTFSLEETECADNIAEVNTSRYKVVVSSESGVLSSDPQHIYLIDHAWTYRVDSARRNLREIPGLLSRMANLMGIEDANSEEEVESVIDAVFNEMWKYNMTYSVRSGGSVEDSMPVWYIMDEFGSAIQHSDSPTFRTVPFIFLPEQITYSLLFPIKDLSLGQEVTRDYVETLIEDSAIRDALLLPWVPKSFLSENFKQCEPDSQYFLGGHIAETLPETNEELLASTNSKEIFLVFSQYPLVNTFLTHPRFEITSSEDNADILWYTDHFKTFKEFSQTCPQKYVNQFPYENVITIKDLLSIVCRRAVKDGCNVNAETLETYPVWFPTTYNLKTELPKFVSYYQHRSEKSMNNLWICKPFNLARGLDTHITGNLNYILRLPLTGPKIAQKYLEDPVLFDREDCGSVKFDVRYVILLKCVKPLKLYVYRNFFLRFANKPFDLGDFDDYEKHFTVMNYNENANLCRMLCEDFVPLFETQYPNVSWKDVEKNIFFLLKEMFEAAVSKDPPCGIGHNPQSRALYAADIMLTWKVSENGHRAVQPKLLEVNWTPDCQRACEYYPDFYNDVFSLLFLNIFDNTKFALLK